MKKTTSQIFIAIVCAVLGFLLANQFKVLNQSNKTNNNLNNIDIIAEIDALKKEKEELLKVNTELSTELKNLEDIAANEGKLENEIKKQLDNARMNLGLVDVKGPGITITITPKTNIFGTQTNNISSALGEDELVHIVNSLRYVKAEAISINDIRITPQTGIKISGRIIWVGNDKIDPTETIVIKAIGDKQILSGAANFVGMLDYGSLQNYYSEVKESDEIIINKTTQTLKTEYIIPIE